DRRLHRRQQLRHGRHLAHDAGVDADRDQTVRRASMNALVAPEGTLEIVSRLEANQLLSSSRTAGTGGLYDLWRQCSLAVLNTGSQEDDVLKILSRYSDFRISIVQHEGGIAIDLENAPDSAFVGKQMIRGIREHLFAVLRDILYT